MTLDSNYVCNFCPGNAINIVRLLFIGMGFLMLIVFMIRSTLNGAQNIKNVTSVYVKILMNHIQIISLTASFDFNWPELVRKFFDIASYPANVGNSIFSIDCFV